MRVTNFPQILMIVAAMFISVVTGCSDDRVVQVATQAADRQAEQNDAMAKLQQDVAAGTEKLVEADASARHEIIAVHHDLETERSRLDTGWSTLEEERKQLAGERRTESVLLLAIQLLGGLSLVVVLLGFCWYALVKLRADTTTDAELNELLIHELAANESFSLVAPRLPAQIAHDDDQLSADV